MKKIKINWFDGKLKVPFPIGDCWHCKYYEPNKKCNKGCNLLNGMKYFENNKKQLS